MGLAMSFAPLLPAAEVLTAATVGASRRFDLRSYAVEQPGALTSCPALRCQVSKNYLASVNKLLMTCGSLQRAICTQITNNVKVRKGVGSTRDYVDLCSSLPLTGRLLSAA